MERSPDTVGLASQKVEMRGDLNRVCSVLGGKHSHLQWGPDGLSPHILSCCLFTEAPGEGAAQVNKQVGIWNLSYLQEPPPTRRPVQGECAEPCC